MMNGNHTDPGKFVFLFVCSFHRTREINQNLNFLQVFPLLLQRPLFVGGYPFLPLNLDNGFSE